MSRIKKRFSALSSSNRKALIPYVVVGDPSLDITLSLMHEMVLNGADLLELGVPFSDPMAEGPIIQASHARSLASAVNLEQVLHTVGRFREKDDDTPVILMGYANPVERMGYDTFAKVAAKVGLDGLLTVDMPLEEIDSLQKVAAQFELDNILLIAPTSPNDRIRRIVSKATGFLYCVSLKGVTGSEHLDLDQVRNQILYIRQVTDLPVVVGFGIKDRDTAKSVGEISDGVVVGSAIVDCLAQNAVSSTLAVKNVGGLIAELRTGLDEGI